MRDKQLRKTKMFYEAGGKCQYCGCNMILTYANCWKGVERPDNIATIEHKYNRDHELRNGNTDEKRLYIVCNRCNNNKARTEPNLNEKNDTMCIVKKIAPKDRWSDEVYMNKITEAIERENELNRENALINKELNKLLNQKSANDTRISKSVRYRNDLVRIRQETA